MEEEEIFNELSIRKNLEEFAKEYYDKSKKSDELKKFTENIIVEKILKRTEKEDISNSSNNSVLNIANHEAALLYIKIVKILYEPQKNKEEYKKIIKVLASAKDKYGNTLLHSSVILFAHYKVVDLLLKNGANVNAKNEDGCIPLHLAIKNGHLAVADLLLKNGAKIDAKNTRGDTTLHYAVANGNSKSVDFLLENGVKIDAENIHGDTPLHYAAENRQLEVLNTLLEKVKNINSKNKKDNTPLHIAVLYNQADVVEKLLEKSGIDINIANKDGNTPLHLAACNGCLEAVEFLLGGGAKITIQNKNGEIPLQLAVRNGHSDTAKLLIENDAKNEAGKTAVFVAIALIAIAIAAVVNEKIEFNTRSITYAIFIISISTLILSFLAHEIALKCYILSSKLSESSAEQESLQGTSISALT